MHEKKYYNKKKRKSLNLLGQTKLKFLYFKKKWKGQQKLKEKDLKSKF